jgi:hypothetical protein
MTQPHLTISSSDGSSLQMKIHNPSYAPFADIGVTSYLSPILTFLMDLANVGKRLFIR